ncbi:nucleic acid/nucleotide deaminase domain-containing protein [Streptomyces sp. NPDC048581]|uniref:nucleic acid/nucleotide deaminase domain-containing protein n=1 Tax=unclassified Streptomyces TaxID=2593676 RepID=UPI00371AE889
MAQAMREFAADIDDGAADAHAAIADLIGTNEGLAVQALERHWSKVKDIHLSNLAEAGRLAATALDGVAVLIEGAKLAAITQLGILAAEIAAAIAASTVTLGLSALGGLAATQVTRVAVKRIFQEVCEEVASRVIEVAMGPVYEAIGSMAGDLVVQLGGNALGVQNGVDLSQTAKAGKDGLDAGIDSAKSGGAMQLASANGPSGGMGDLGGGGGQFSMDLASYDRAGTQLKGAGGKIRDGAGGKLSRAKSTHGRTKGKDPIADAANAMLDQVIDGIEKGVKRSAKHLDENMTNGLNKMAKRHRSNDDDIATELQSISKTSHGNTPVFHVDDEGRVTRLTSAGHQDLTDEDRARLGPLRLDSEGFVEDRKAVNYALPEVRHKKPSQQVEFGSTDLSQATQLARQANRDYGQYRKGKFSSRNYAAARYGQLGDQDGFILVGRSKFPGQHSERQVGIPFLDAGATDRMTELYTEREPCTTGSGARDCSAWMSHHLPDSVQVSHTVEYGATEDSKKQGNAQMEQYLNGLNPKKRSHN